MGDDELAALDAESAGIGADAARLLDHILSSVAAAKVGDPATRGVRAFALCESTEAAADAAAARIDALLARLPPAARGRWAATLAAARELVAEVRAGARLLADARSGGGDGSFTGAV